MKILFLHMTMGLVDRGSELSTDLIATGLAKDHEVLLLQSGEVGKKSYQVKQVFPLTTAPPPAPTGLVGKLLFRLKLDPQSLLVYQFTKACLSIVKDFVPDIIVATNGARQLSIVKENFPAVKTVVFGRAGIGHDDLATLRARPDLFIALTNEAQSWATEHAHSATRIVYIPNPIDLALYQSAKPIDIKLPHPTLLVVGALTKYKNIDKVARAARDMSIPLLLIGDGEEQVNILEILSSYKVKYRYLAHVDPHELPSHYLSADAFCLIPDSQEAFGRVYLEAMAAGLPIVASDDPIRRAIVGKQGYFVKVDSYSELTDSLRQALLKRAKVDYSHELRPYKIETVLEQLTTEFGKL